MERADSVFHYYQKLIALRKKYPIIVYGTYELLLADSEELYIYTRSLGEQKLLTICNFTEKTLEYTLPEGFAGEGTEVLISNYGRESVRQ